ncbi:6,7-dimethyl-8-ribityllumazine synthase [Aurantivibrio plasticivorans]
MKENGKANRIWLAYVRDTPVRPDSGYSELSEETMNQINQVNSYVASKLPSDTRIAFIQSCWSKDIVDQCRDSFIASVIEQGIEPSNIDCFEVPGALEIPLQAKLLAKTGRYNIVVASGLVVDGGIYRHEFVADAIIKSFMEVQLETEVPIISAVLTPHNFHEHQAHHDYFFDHFKIKGQEAANACLKTLMNVELVKEL